MPPSVRPDGIGSGLLGGRGAAIGPRGRAASSLREITRRATEEVAGCAVEGLAVAAFDGGRRQREWAHAVRGEAARRRDARRLSAELQRASSPRCSFKRVDGSKLGGKLPSGGQQGQHARGSFVRVDGATGKAVGRPVRAESTLCHQQWLAERALEREREALAIRGGSLSAMLPAGGGGSGAAGVGVGVGMRGAAAAGVGPAPVLVKRKRKNSNCVMQ